MKFRSLLPAVLGRLLLPATGTSTGTILLTWYNYFYWLASGARQLAAS
jgi:hypothetical protein